MRPEWLNEIRAENQQGRERGARKQERDAEKPSLK